MPNSTVAYDSSIYDTKDTLAFGAYTQLDGIVTLDANGDITPNTSTSYVQKVFYDASETSEFFSANVIVELDNSTPFSEDALQTLAIARLQTLLGL